MNKKINIFLILIFSLIPFIIKRSDYNDITKIIHINSIGIDYNSETNEYECYFYIFNNFNLASAKISSSNIDNLAYIIKTKDKDFNKAMLNVYQAIKTTINFSHLKTIILSKNFFFGNNLNDLFNFIINNTDFYYNFYFLSTTSDMKEVYNINNFSDVTAYHTILSNPELIKTYKLVSFNSYSNFILNKNFTLSIPNLIVLEDIFYKQDKPSNILELNGYSYFNNKSYINTITINEESNIKWLVNLSNKHININKYNLYIKNGKYRVIYRNNNVYIKYHLTAILLNNPQNLLITELETIINKLIQDEILSLYYKFENIIDLYNIKYLNKPYENIFIKVKLELN